MTLVAYADTPPRNGWDIHCHTVYSDGTETPRTLVREAVRRGLHGVAIADHDTTAGWQEAEQAARELSMTLLRGTEITAVDDGVSVHMLGLQYDPGNAGIRELFAATRRARLRRTRRMVEMIAKDYPITWEDVLAQTKQGERTTIGRPHIADALVAAGVYPTRSDAFAGGGERIQPVLHPHALAHGDAGGGSGEGRRRREHRGPRGRSRAQPCAAVRYADRTSGASRSGRS